MANVLKSNVLKTAKASSETEEGGNGDAARKISGLAGFNLSDLADEGRQRLEQCRREIQQLMSQAAADAEQIRENAREQGYQQGIADAAKDADVKLKAEAQARSAEGLRLIQQAVEQLHRIHEDWMQQYATSLQHIALSIAERIVRRRLQEEPELLLTWTSDAIQLTRSSCRVTVAVHPETLASLGDALDQLLDHPELPEQIEIIPDDNVAVDAVVIRQDGGSINAGLEAQFQRLEELLS